MKMVTTQCGVVRESQYFASFDEIKKKDSPWINLELAKEGDNAIIKVTDSGNGIPKEIQRNILKPFFTTKGPGEGTGLGLSISKKIIMSHKGKFEIDNTSKNTCFKITLPLSLK